MRPSWELSGVRTEHQTFVRQQRRGRVTAEPCGGQAAPSTRPHLVLRRPGVRKVCPAGKEETVSGGVPHPCIRCGSRPCQSQASALNFT